MKQPYCLRVVFKCEIYAIVCCVSRERNTSDARAVILRQHDDPPTRHREDKSVSVNARHRETTRHREERMRASETRHSDASTTLYKRGELISSARAPPP